MKSESAEISLSRLRTTPPGRSVIQRSAEMEDTANNWGTVSSIHNHSVYAQSYLQFTQTTEKTCFRAALVDDIPELGQMTFYRSLNDTHYSNQLLLVLFKRGKHRCNFAKCLGLFKSFFSPFLMCDILDLKILYVYYWNNACIEYRRNIART